MDKLRYRKPGVKTVLGITRINQHQHQDHEQRGRIKRGCSHTCLDSACKATGEAFNDDSTLPCSPEGSGVVACFMRSLAQSYQVVPCPWEGATTRSPEPGREGFYEKARSVYNIHQAPETPSLQAVGPDRGDHAPCASPGGWLWGTSDDSGLSYCDIAPNTLPDSHRYDDADAYRAANALANGKTQSNTDGHPETLHDLNPNQDAKSHPYFSLRPVAWSAACVLRRN